MGCELTGPLSRSVFSVRWGCELWNVLGANFVEDTRANNDMYRELVVEDEAELKILSEDMLFLDMNLWCSIVKTSLWSA